MIEDVRHKVRQLYLFLKEANQLRFPPVRTLSQHPRVLRLADAPEHACVQITRPARGEVADGMDDCLLRVRRPSLVTCPSPPASVSQWLLPDWAEPGQAAYFAQHRNAAGTDGAALTIRFEDDPQRVSDFEAWSAQRDQWAAEEVAARRALKFFELFYEIHAAIERDGGEQLELVAADGRLSWRAESSIEGMVPIDHPILLKRVELRFDAVAAQFSIHETDRPTEVYSAMLADLKNPAVTSLRARTAEIDNGAHHPWAEAGTESFLKAVVQTLSPTSGRLLEDGSSEEPTDAPRIWRDPMLILRKRSGGIANAVDAIIDDIEERKVFAPALMQITGFDVAGAVDASPVAAQTPSEVSATGAFPVLAPIDDEGGWQARG